MKEERNTIELKNRKQKKSIDVPSITETKIIANSTITEDQF